MGFLSWAQGSSSQPSASQPAQVFDRPWQGFAQHSPAYEQAAGSVTHKRYIPGAGWVTMGRPGEGKPPGAGVNSYQGDAQVAGYGDSPRQKGEGVMDYVRRTGKFPQGTAF